MSFADVSGPESPVSLSSTPQGPPSPSAGDSSTLPKDGTLTLGPDPLLKLWLQSHWCQPALLCPVVASLRVAVLPPSVPVLCVVRPQCVAVLLVVPLSRFVVDLLLPLPRLPSSHRLLQWLRHKRLLLRRPSPPKTSTRRLQPSEMVFTLTITENTQSEVCWLIYCHPRFRFSFFRTK